jgi:hypothetical protein
MERLAQIGLHPKASETYPDALLVDDSAAWRLRTLPPPSAPLTLVDAGLDRPLSGRGGCINVHADFGANGEPGDGKRIQLALDQVASRGGCVYLPSIGRAYVLDAGISVPAGVAILGDGTMNFPGMTSAVSQWTARGTWLLCADRSKPCVSVPGHGSTFEGINLIWNQIAPPSSEPYTPIEFPDGLHVRGSFFRIRHSLMIGGTRCINIDYSEESGGGTYSQLQDLKLGCLNVGIRWSNVNDNVYVRDIDVRPLWHVMSDTLIAFVQTNLVGMDVHYFDNPVIDGYQCLFCQSAFRFTNGTILGNTHALYNGQLSNIQCNLVRICMQLSAPSTQLSFKATNFLAQQDTDRRHADTLFQFGTDRLDVGFTNLTVITAGAKVMAVGNGLRGNVDIGTLNLGTAVADNPVNGYSVLKEGEPAFVVNAGASLSIASRSVTRARRAGAFITGSGAANVSMPTRCWNVVAHPGQKSMGGTGAFQDIDASTFWNLQGDSSWIQMKMIGAYRVTSGVPGSQAVFRIATDPPVLASVPTGTPGLKVFDSQWIDIFDRRTTVGRLQQKTIAGVVGQLSELMICAR